MVTKTWSGSRLVPTKLPGWLRPSGKMGPGERDQSVCSSVTRPGSDKESVSQAAVPPEASGAHRSLVLSMAGLWVKHLLQGPRASGPAPQPTAATSKSAPLPHACVPPWTRHRAGIQRPRV